MEVDITYPSSLNDSHNDLPLASEKFTIDKSCISYYAQTFDVQFSTDGRRRLVETLDKIHYVCHYRNLKYYVNHGLLVTKLHRVVHFRQSKWLGDYISKNTAIRNEASNDFEKFLQAYEQCLFQQNNRKSTEPIVFVSSKKEAEKSFQNPNFKSYQIIHDGLVSMSFTNSKIVWSKPTPVGASILDLSKLSLCKFHYDEMELRFDDKITVCYKDTDSLLKRIETDDLYSEMATSKHRLDLSDYPADHFLHDKSNKKVPLTMTDELQGNVLHEIVCLRSKLYFIKFEGGVKQSAKGGQRCVKKSLHHDFFKSCLLNKANIKRSMPQLRSKNQQIFVNRVVKIAVRSYDDKISSRRWYSVVSLWALQIKHT